MSARRLHLPLLLILGASAARAADPPATVAVDLSALDDATFTKVDGTTLETKALARLVQDGFAVVAASASPQLLIRLVAVGDGVDLQGSAGTEQALRHVPLAAAPVPELQLELVQKVSELVRELISRRHLAPASTPAGLPGDAPLPPSEVEPPRRISLALGATALFRGVVDPMISFGFRWGRPTGLAGVAELAFTPSQGQDIMVQEVGATVGASYRWQLRQQAALEVGARVGAQWQFYTLGSAADANPDGSPAAFLAEVPVELLTWLSPNTAFTARVVPGLAGPIYDHTESGASIWSRSVLRLGGGITVQHQF